MSFDTALEDEGRRPGAPPEKHQDLPAPLTRFEGETPEPVRIRGNDEERDPLGHLRECENRPQLRQPRRLLPRLSPGWGLGPDEPAIKVDHARGRER